MRTEVKDAAGINWNPRHTHTHTHIWTMEYTRMENTHTESTLRVWFGLPHTRPSSVYESIAALQS
ncbi:hypothetical protein TMatcc_009161 [Talaromyces marneffei ATCC 18224]